MGGRDLAFRVAAAAEAVGVAVLGSCPVLDFDVEVGEGAQPALHDGPGAVHGVDGPKGRIVRAPKELLLILQVVLVLLHVENVSVQFALRGWPPALALVELLAPIADDDFTALLVLAEDPGDLLGAEVGVQDEAPCLGPAEVRKP